MPPAFARQKASLKKLPLYELTEALIQLFGLREQQGEFTYLQAFQDVVLNFFNRERNDLNSFLIWWEENKHKTAIQVSGDIDAMQILTVHKSKGLQFRYVIIPFCSWSMDHEFGKFPNLWVRTSRFFYPCGMPACWRKLFSATSTARNERDRTWIISTCCTWR